MVLTAMVLRRAGDADCCVGGAGRTPTRRLVGLVLKSAWWEWLAPHQFSSRAYPGLCRIADLAVAATGHRESTCSCRYVLGEIHP
jgi:hypothetical protein